MPRTVDITGKTFGHLTVLGLDHRRHMPGHNESWWLCRCDCGTEKLIERRHLTGGSTKSCGCHRNERERQPELRIKLRKVWDDMVRRCIQKNHRAFKRYGARGINVCDSWLDFENFYAWALASGYSKGLTLDRTNNDLGYSPENCRWVTMKQQENNKSNNHRITYLGVTNTIMWWSELCGINFSTLRQRLVMHNFTVEDALLIPPGKKEKALVPHGSVINHRTGQLTFIAA